MSSAMIVPTDLRGNAPPPPPEPELDEEEAPELELLEDEELLLEDVPDSERTVAE